MKFRVKESLTEQVHATLNLTVELSGIGWVILFTEKNGALVLFHYRISSLISE